MSRIETTAESGKKDYREKLEPLKWFNKYPLVSVILWILGTEIQVSPDSLSDSKNNISWKDDHGGFLHEYINQVQRNTKEDRALDATFTLQSGLKGNFNRDFREETKDSSLAVENNRSPSWGFYVSMTPPQDEF